ncbi:LTA synthase family protein [uncultured Kocuria sp.]|uniref:LTA synthase family protein n=1 Tax=uncultured Kocuria sp. TaxID=259305 RepID=UPI0025935BC8|nr:LTA synthase family protein [uncultured Kocuria sp.]MCT1367636.1 LTA synthase family protein [Rothia sp. p3-SID1597]
MSGRTPRALKRACVILGTVLVYVLIWAGLTTLIAAIGIRHFWGRISVSQMLTNLVSVQTDGGGGSLVWMGLIFVGILPIVITLGIAVFRYYRHRRRKRLGIAPSQQRAPWIGRSVSVVMVMALTIGGTSAFATTVGVGDFIRSASSPYNMADYYKNPQVTDNANKRNLVTIYLESGEQTLADDQLFEKDAFKSLEDATPESEGWQSVDSLQQYNGGGWTMAGLTSTQCGVPLKGASSAIGSAGSSSDDGSSGNYLGGLNCVGDVLGKQGYKNVFLGGANGSFAGKDKFLGGHGYTEEKDLDDWRAMGEPEKNFRSDWGLSDQRLMSHAKDEIDQLHADAEKTGQPFNLSMLTLDTHEPVHIYDYCNVDTKSDVTSVFACSMEQVAGYVNYMKEKGYLDDTAVVIMGDHLKHMSAGDAFHEELDNNPNRSIFNRVWVPGDKKSTSLRPRIDQLNMFPTLLEAAGLELKDHEAGLGVSAFEEKVPEGSAQSLPPDQYATLLDSLSSSFYNRAWTGTKPEN